VHTGRLVPRRCRGLGIAVGQRPRRRTTSPLLQKTCRIARRQRLPGVVTENIIVRPTPAPVKLRAGPVAVATAIPPRSEGRLEDVQRGRTNAFW
jgi:hypothetical protein